MKNIYLVQVDVSSDAKSQVVYLPYAAGIIAAAAWKSEEVKKNYNFGGFLFRRDAIDTACKKIKDPYLVGFSNYCWNAEYNRLLSLKIKEKYPECIIVYGGHNIPDNKEYLEERPYVDILLHGEGEYNFRELLKGLLKNDISGVYDITYRTPDGDIVRGPHYGTPRDINDFPSPYLEGWFDDIVKNNPNTMFNAILETSRGCPNQCAYCDWGLLKARTRMFDLDRVKAEIRWMSDNKIGFIWGADANFGMFERDMEIVDELIRVKKETGYPEKMRMNYSKTNYQNVFEITKKLCENDCDRIGATLSLQSLNPEVLHNIGRTNMSVKFFMELLKKYRENHIKTYSELILALPGETYETFVEGLGKLLEMGQHLVFEVYGCILLPNSRLGQKDMIEKFQLKTVKTELQRGHTTGEAIAIPEYDNLITSTSTLSQEDWTRATLFYQFLKAMHGNGLIRTFAIYLYYEQGIKYQDFYQQFIDYIRSHKDFFLHDYVETLYIKDGHMSRGEPFDNITFEPLGNFIWNEHEYLVLNTINNFDLFYDQFRDFIARFNIPSDILEDLFLYQKAIIRRPWDEKDEIELHYDMHGYFSDIYINEKKDLMPLHHKLILKDQQPRNSWAEFGKFVVWYGNMGWESYKEDISKEIL